MKTAKVKTLVISATSRTGARTLEIAQSVSALLSSQGSTVKLLDLAKLPLEVFHPSVYDCRPTSFDSWQADVDSSDGIIICVPEYNGSVPGIFKHFLDILRYPDTLQGKSVAIIGLASGTGGGRGAVAALTELLKFQNAKVFHVKVLIPRCHEVVSQKGDIINSDIKTAIEEQLKGFLPYCHEEAMVEHV